MPYAERPDVEVLALRCDGLPVAFEVEEAISSPLDVFVVRRLEVPGNAGVSMGVLASGDVRILDEQVIRQLGVAQEVVDEVTKREREELHRCERAYRGRHGPMRVKGRVAIMVEDGLSCGLLMQTAIQACRRLGPSRIVVATPVASRDACEAMRRLADEFVCLYVPDPFATVDAYYESFPRVSESEARLLLERGRSPGCCSTTDPAAGIHAVS
jgi:putative phosphoribosyl transferase